MVGGWKGVGVGLSVGGGGGGTVSGVGGMGGGGKGDKCEGGVRRCAKGTGDCVWEVGRAQCAQKAIFWNIISLQIHMKH